MREAPCHSDRGDAGAFAGEKIFSRAVEADVLQPLHRRGAEVAPEGCVDRAGADIEMAGEIVRGNGALRVALQVILRVADEARRGVVGGAAQQAGMAVRLLK